MNIGWKTRLGIAFSAVWLCIVFLSSSSYQRTSEVLSFGLLPLIVIWGIVWAVNGWRSNRPVKSETTEASLIEEKRKRRDRIRTFIAVVAVLGIGLISANWQVHLANNNAGDVNLSRWFGRGFVYGLITYAIFKAIPRLLPGMAAMLASLVVVGTVNYLAYAEIAENRQIKESLAKAAPLINKMQSGTMVSDQEIKSAKVGKMEPLLLSMATCSRELQGTAANHEKKINDLQLEEVLAPISLASPSVREQTRVKLKLLQNANTENKSQIQAIYARCKLALEAAQSQITGSGAASFSKGLDESLARGSTYLATLDANNREVIQAVVQILDLMDVNSGAYVVDKGPPPNLLFRDEDTLVKYREMYGLIVAAAQREQEAQAVFVKAQADLTAELGTLLKN